MRLIVTLLLLTFTAPAWAEWVKLGETDESIFYIDPSTISRDGSLRRVFEVQDLKARDKSGALSVRLSREYDCKQGRLRVLWFSTHTESMTGGRAIDQSSETFQWDYVGPGTAAEKALRLVCAEWTLVSENADAMFYIDFATIKKNGQFARVWEIADLKKRGKRGEVSMRALVEYDCQEKRSRFLQMSLHPEPMAGGTTLASAYKPDQWTYVPPDAASMTVLKVVCTN